RGRARDRRGGRVPGWFVLGADAGFAHAFGGLRRAFAADLRLDSPPDIGVDVLPVLDGTAEHRLAHPAEQAAGDLVDQRLAVLVAEHLAHQGAGLAEVVVVGTQRVGAAHHLAVGLPAVVHPARLVRPRPAAAVGGID